MPISDRDTYIAIFLDKTDRSGECWIWTAGTHSSGYGSFSMNGESWKSHRAAYALLVGEIPRGMHVLHRCDRKLCCNPEHLFLGTHLDNMRDMATKGRSPHGSTHTWAKLTESQVADIRRRFNGGSRWARGNGPDLEKEFGISHATLFNIIARNSWKHVS